LIQASIFGMRVEQRLFRLGVAQHLGEVEIGGGEAVADEIVVSARCFSSTASGRFSERQATAIVALPSSVFSCSLS
jgi:hypothetical protein